MQRVVASKLLNRRVDVLIVWTWKWCSTVRPPRVLFFFFFLFWIVLPEWATVCPCACNLFTAISIEALRVEKKAPRKRKRTRNNKNLQSDLKHKAAHVFRRPLWAFQPLTLFFFLKRESTKLFYFYSTICKLEMKRQVKSTELSTILTLSFKVFWQQNAKFTKLMKWGHSTASIIRLTKWKQVCAASDAVGTGNWRKRIYNWDIIRQA